MEKNTDPRPDLYSFDNYRDFLRVQFDFIKRHSKGFSYRYCAERLQTSSGYLKHIIEKRRNLGPEYISGVAKLLRLSKDEKRYFTILVLRDTIRDRETRQYFDEILASLKGAIKTLGSYRKEPISSIEHDIVLQDWLVSTIQEMARFEDFKPEPAWIKERLIDQDISDEQLQEALSLLFRKKMITNEKGKYVPVYVHSEPSSFNLDSFKIYRSGLSKSYQILDNVMAYRKATFFMGAFAVDEKTEMEIIEGFCRFRDSAVEKAKLCKNPKLLVWISNNLFNLVKR